MSAHSVCILSLYPRILIPPRPPRLHIVAAAVVVVGPDFMDARVALCARLQAVQQAYEAEPDDENRQQLHVEMLQLLELLFPHCLSPCTVSDTVVWSLTDY
jgi:hypothetical protein